MKQLNEIMGLADTGFALRLLRLMTMDIKKTKAFKLGLIDKDYKRLKKPETGEEKTAYTLFHKLAFNLRKLIRKVPIVGKLTVSSYLAALWLIKDHTELSDEQIGKILKEVTGEDISKFSLTESSLFINKNCQLQMGTYILNKNLLLPRTGEELIHKGTEVIVKESCEPSGFIFSTPVYKVYHPKTRQSVYITQGDIKDA